MFISTRAPFPPTTGHFQRTFNILIRMARLSDIHFFGFFDKGLGAEEQRRVTDELQKHCCSVYLECIPADNSFLAKSFLAIRSLLTRRPVVALKYARASMRKAIQCQLDTTNIDLVHLDMLPLIEYERLFQFQPVVLTNHNVESARIRRLAAREPNWLLRLFLKHQASKLARYEALAMQRLEHVIAVSNDDRRVLAASGHQTNFYVVPNGTDTAHYDLAASSVPTRPLDPVILWVGSAEDPYNRQAILYFFEEIFPIILEVRDDVVFRFVGKMSDSLRVSLQNKFGSNFDFKGFVDDVRDHYAESKMVCIPLLSGSGTKLKVIEALAMRRAVVTTPIGAEGLEVTHGEHLLIGETAGEIAGEVLRLLTDSGCRERLELEGRRLVESQYDWDEIVRRQWDEYTRIIDQGVM